MSTNAPTEDVASLTETLQQFLQREVAERARGFDDSRQFYRAGFYRYTIASVSALSTTGMQVASSF